MRFSQGAHALLKLARTPAGRSAFSQPKENEEKGLGEGRTQAKPRNEDRGSSTATQAEGGSGSQERWPARNGVTEVTRTTSGF